MNIFEGSRRIAKLTAAGIAVGVLIAIAYGNPEPVSVAYLITDGKAPPTRVDECQSGAKIESREVVAKSGKSVSINLCLSDLRKNVEVPVSGSKVYKVKAPDGAVTEVTGSEGLTDDQIIALAKAQMRLSIMSNPFYISANEATKKAIRSKWGLEADEKRWQAIFDPDEWLRRHPPPPWETFTIPEADEAYITRLGWLNTAKSAGMYLLGMLASLATFWAFTWAVGWIVRGFMGIPQGKDSKE